MVTKKDLVIAVLATFCLTATLFMIIPIGSSEGDNYDPWIDVNGDGHIDLDDLYAIAQHYGTTGDTTKNVNVTNWPVSHDELVWWQVSLDPNGYAFSNIIHANGFGHLHVIATLSDIYGNATLTFVAWLINADIQQGIPITFYSFVFNAFARDLVVTLDVPSEQFMFRARTDAESSCIISLSYYLTWS